jgi:phthalate 4,5-dioxygenase reductase component
MNQITEEASVEIDTLATIVKRKERIADDIVLFELVSADAAVKLPRFTSGSHVEVLARNGSKRQYSLCNAPSDGDRYVIAIKREAEGRGGSVSMVDEVAVGDRLLVSHPKNYFSLDKGATRHLFIAGGIGITPILSMTRELAETQGDFRLVYCTRSPETTAFAAELAEPAFADRTTIHHDHGDRAQSFDLESLLAERAEGTHLYCCGPGPLMRAVRELTRHWPKSAVHFEDFSTTLKEGKPSDAEFTVHLARQGVTIGIAPGVSVLDALRRHGVAVPSSCESGTCGSCRTKLLEGIPDHRDYILDDDETQEIMICVSRAKSKRLVLDI